MASQPGGIAIAHRAYVVELVERLGNLAAHLATGNPATARLVYFGKLADTNTNLLRSAGLAGVLARSTPHRP